MCLPVHLPACSSVCLSACLPVCIINELGSLDGRHRCELCRNALATTCKTAHRWFYTTYDMPSSIMDDLPSADVDDATPLLGISINGKVADLVIQSDFLDCVTEWALCLTSTDSHDAESGQSRRWDEIRLVQRVCAWSRRRGVQTRWFKWTARQLTTLLQDLGSDVSRLHLDDWQYDACSKHVGDGRSNPPRHTVWRIADEGLNQGGIAWPGDEHVLIPTNARPSSRRTMDDFRLRDWHWQRDLHVLAALRCAWQEVACTPDGGIHLLAFLVIGMDGGLAVVLSDPAALHPGAPVMHRCLQSGGSAARWVISVTPWQAQVFLCGLTVISAPWQWALHHFYAAR